MPLSSLYKVEYKGCQPKKKFLKNGIFGKPIALLFSRKMDPQEALIFLVKKACNKRKA